MRVLDRGFANIAQCNAKGSNYYRIFIRVVKVSVFNVSDATNYFNPLLTQSVTSS